MARLGMAYTPSSHTLATVTMTTDLGREYCGDFNTVELIQIKYACSFLIGTARILSFDVFGVN